MTDVMNEQKQRVAEIARYDILDTVPEILFDDLVLLARLVCEAPIATTTFVTEERQWFKAVTGLDFCESPIAQSICAYTTRQPETFLINDLVTDRRTREMLIVTNPPFARFYAGVPLKNVSGTRMGTICVMDTKARPAGLTLNQSLCLEALARQVVANLELRLTMPTGKR